MNNPSNWYSKTNSKEQGVLNMSDAELIKYLEGFWSVYEDVVAEGTDFDLLDVQQAAMEELGYRNLEAAQESGVPFGEKFYYEQEDIDAILSRIAVRNDVNVASSLMAGAL